MNTQGKCKQELLSVRSSCATGTPWDELSTKNRKIMELMQDFFEAKASTTSLQNRNFRSVIQWLL